MITTVHARVELPGWHSWPRAPEHRSYLTSLHRHLFHIEAGVRVSHDDRDVEFHDLSDDLRSWWGDPQSKHDRGSCESLAASLAEHLVDRGYVVTEVMVAEDGESWATVTDVMPRPVFRADMREAMG